MPVSRSHLSRSHLSRVLAIVAALTLLAALPATVVAAPVSRFTDDRTFVNCNLTGEDGSAIFLIAEVSEEFGNFGVLAVWQPPADPFVDAPTFVSGDAEVVISADGMQLTATYELWTFDPTVDPPLGEFVGTATLTTTLTPVGDPEPFLEEFREGNRKIRVEGVRQALSVEGELDLLGTTVTDLSDCLAVHEMLTFFGTNPAGIPASFIFRSDQISLNCSWETDGMSVSLFAATDQFGTFSDLFVGVGPALFFGSAPDAVLTTSAYSATFELLDEFGEPAGSAAASATLTPTGERFRFTDRQGTSAFKQLGEVLAVDGLLELTIGAETLSLAMDSESCQGFDGRIWFHEVRPNGPKAGPLPNDLPENAEPIQIGQTVRLVTGGNALEPEAPCIGGIDPETGEPFAFPITFTAWWTLTGTGEPVTVTTAGSNFDTVLAVYQLVEGELVQVACVDDVFEPEFSLQAEVTIATEEGALYYIQAGGFAGSAGRLQLTVE